MDVAEFLLARIAEDEETANRARTAAGDGDLWVATGMDKPVGVDYDPARVLAEVDAKRRIVEEHGPFSSKYAQGDWCRMCVYESGWPFAGAGGYPFPCLTLRLLALPYADRADYDPEWKV